MSHKNVNRQTDRLGTKLGCALVRRTAARPVGPNMGAGSFGRDPLGRARVARSAPAFGPRWSDRRMVLREALHGNRGGAFTRRLAADHYFAAQVFAADPDRNAA